jgi:cytochrome c-type biogenesis protein CcmE
MDDGVAQVSQKAFRIVLTVVVLGGALGALLAMTLRSDAQFYKHVNEVMVEPQQWYGKQLQLHGTVVDGSIQWRPNTLDRRFQVKSGDSVVTASYTGVVPDTFKDGSEVVLRGKLAADGFHVDPDGVIAKCPSRYESASPSGK